MVILKYRGRTGAVEMEVKDLTFVKNLKNTDEVVIVSDIDAGDGFRYAVVHTRNPVTGAEYVFIIKYTMTGWTKSITRLPVGVAKAFAKAILERIK